MEKSNIEHRLTHEDGFRRDYCQHARRNAAHDKVNNRRKIRNGKHKEETNDI